MNIDPKSETQRFKRGTCAECGKATKHSRSWFCDNICKWKNRFFPHPSKRNNQYFYQYTGMSMPRGQGKRSGSTVQGAMGLGVVPNWLLIPVTKEALDKHFQSISAGYQDTVQLGSGTYVTKQKAYEIIQTPEP